MLWVISSFGDGGLNIASLKVKNQALLDGGWGSVGGIRLVGRGVWADIICVGKQLDELDGSFENQFAKKVGDGLHTSFWNDKTLWNNLVPRKVNVFVWRALNGRLPVRIELDKKGIDLDTLLCPGCDNVVESLDHCLVLCENVINVWDMIFAWWGVGLTDVFTVKELLCHKGKSSMGKESRLLWQTTIWVAAYFVWKNRNNRVFKGKSENSSRLFNEIQLKTFEWIHRRAKKWEIRGKWLTRPVECGVVRNRSAAGDSDGDIGATCVFPDAALRTSLLDAVCEIVGRIETNDAANIFSQMEEIESQLSAAEAAKINVSWLRASLKAIHKRNEAGKKKISLQRPKVVSVMASLCVSDDVEEADSKTCGVTNHLDFAFYGHFWRPRHRCR
nr:phospholipase-like protein [Tanacetum cinerariifolium]